ncbi:hypothetical protein [Caudoviricetes sp.]|nr:hypothetical protein [Caudoviricetes sp.]UOF81886.1 hypothetical protein [Caudoviricetes sp.]
MTREERDRLGLEIESMTSLINHPGWKLLADRIDKQREVSLMEMRNAKDAFLMQRASMAYAMYTDLLKSPQAMLDHAVGRLNIARSLDKQQK